ncbi:hypothetical protein [Deinococcus pimensis]|uniref:hypothetical protein n=1 Tax=Deinococcus pimensis TaxID=309888 RepID=UPI000481D892|nr:hypothetical protein [Deinococcus pimensis]
MTSPEEYRDELDRRAANVLLDFTGVALLFPAGVWVQWNVLPIPIVTTAETLAHVAVYLAWNTALLLLLGRSLYRRPWNGARRLSFQLLALSVGVVAGFMSGGPLGATLGLLFSFGIGPLAALLLARLDTPRRGA